MVYILEILFYIKIIFNTKAKNKIENSLNIYKPSGSECAIESKLYIYSLLSMAHPQN